MAKMALVETGKDDFGRNRSHSSLMWATRDKCIVKSIDHLEYSYNNIIYKLITCHNPITKMLMFP